MLTPAKIKETFLAEVDSRNIRYTAYPTAVQAVIVATDVELFAVGTGPLTDFWLCGWTCVVDNIIADVTLNITLGYGGDAGANPPDVYVVTTFPMSIGAVGGSVGPTEVPNVMLPYPVRIPGGVRMAVITAAVTGTVTIDEFRVIVATAVGT